MMLDIMPSSDRSSLALVCPLFTQTFARQPVRLPALERLIAYGGAGLVTTPQSTALDAWQLELLHALNLSDALQYPSAPLTWLGASGEIETGTWLLADPVFLAMSSLGLALNLSAPWSASNLAAVGFLVREHLAAEQLEWRVAGGQAFIHRIAPLDVQTVSARHAAQGELQESLPTGNDATTLRRVLTELQMLIHEKVTDPAAPNAIWLWGGGEIPELQPMKLPAMWANDNYTRGVYRAHAASDHCSALPPSLDAIEQSFATRGVAVITKCALDELERQWFAPALRALDSGRLKEVDIYLDGWRLHAERSLLRRLFARPRSLLESMT